MPQKDKNKDKMEDRYTRTKMLIGDKIDALKAAKVLVCGVGGVGGYVVEALARVGVGTIAVLDNDVFSDSNLNRQILATVDTIGKRKTEVAEQRIKAINPDCKTIAYDLFYMPDTAQSVPVEDFDYIVDAIDTVSAKLALIVRAKMRECLSSRAWGRAINSERISRFATYTRQAFAPLQKLCEKSLNQEE